MLGAVAVDEAEKLTTIALEFDFANTGNRQQRVGSPRAD